MNDLKIAPEFDLPVEAITRRIAVIGMSGSGKSNTASVLVEKFLQAGAQVVILDNDGTYWSLRLDRNGKDKGYDIPVFGGDHGDIPLDHRSGALVADVVVDRGISVVLDVSAMRKGERKQFSTDFAEQLYRRKRSHKTPMMFVIEEADDYLPQRFGKDQARMVGAYEDITKRGRKYGIGSILISQRPQSINKEGLNQAEIIFAHYTYGPQERKALADWIVYKHAQVDFVDVLPELKEGEAFVWSPRWLKVMRRIQMPLKRTFDDARTPVLGEDVIKPITMKPKDLEALREMMQTAIQQAEANDPAALKKQIAQLQKELAHAQKNGRGEPIEVPIITDEQMSKLALMVEMARDSSSALLDWGTTVRSDVETLQAALKDVLETVQRAGATPARTRAQDIHREIHSQPLMQKIAAAPKKTDLRDAHQTVLDAVRWFDSIGVSGGDQDIVAYLANRSPTSERYLKVVRELRNGGLVLWENRWISLTSRGYAEANEPDATLTPRDIQDAVLSKLKNKPQAMMQVLIDVFPDAMTYDDLAVQTGQSVTSERFLSKIRWLEKMGVLERTQAQGVNAARAASILFTGKR